MRAYGRLLRRPTAAVSLAATLLSAVPIGMWPLTVVLIAVRGDGGATGAGLLAAAFGIGNAVGILLQGALLVRLRADRLLLAVSVLAVPAAALVAVPGPASLGGAVLAGLSIPAVTPAVRGRFAAVLPGNDRPGAYALVNVLFQVGIAIGPVLTAAMVSAALLGAAPAVAAAFGVASAAVHALGQRGGQPVRSPSGRRVPSRRVSRGGVAVLIGGAVGAGFGIGVLQVLLPVRAGASVSGAAFAALALAEVGAAILLGARVRPRQAPALLVIGSTAMASAYAAVDIATAPVVLLALLLGAATAGQSLGSAMLLDRFVPAERLPAVFAGQIAALVVATAVGALAAGALPGAALIAAALLLGAALSGSALLLVPADRSAGRPPAPSRPSTAATSTGGRSWGR